MCDHTGRRDGNRRNKCDGGVSETERALFYHFKLAWTQKTAGRSLIPFFSLRPRITCHPQSHRPSHRKTLITGCHYVWLHLSLRNLETLFTQPKNTSIRRESRVNRVNVEWLLPPNGTRNWHVLFFFCGFEIVTRTSVGPSHEEEKKKRVVGVMMCADLGKKRPAEGPTEAKSLKTFIKTSLWLLHVLRFVSITYKPKDVNIWCTLLILYMCTPFNFKSPQFVWFWCSYLWEL